MKTNTIHREPVPSLNSAFGNVEGLYTNAEYHEIPGYRFRHDAKPHRHADLAKYLKSARGAFPLRHWIIQDVFNTEYLNGVLRLAAQYGMTGIQFSGDNIYWVGDSPQRYNTYVFTGELCERCHDLGLEAFFWTHEVNGNFHEWVRNGRYGFYGQLAGGTMDLSSKSGFWDALYEKYDVFLRRLTGVDGLVLTVNESQLPVFRDDCIRSDLSPDERVAKVARTVKAACDAHGKKLILRTFCYTPDETERIRRGVKRVARDLTVMVKCQPHDWHTFYPHDPLIEALSDFPRVIEFDMGHEPMGAGRVPYPDTDYLKWRFDYARSQGAMGVAGRVDRFRNHALGTLNWSSVYAFSRLAQAPATPADRIWDEYAVADFGKRNRVFITNLGRRLLEAGKNVFFLAKEWGTQHTNPLTFNSIEHNRRWSCALWSPGEPEAVANEALLKGPTPAFIEEVMTKKRAAVKDVRRLLTEVKARRTGLNQEDYRYLIEALRRTLVYAQAITAQHGVMLMTRHDAARPKVERIYAARIAADLVRLRRLIVHERVRLLDCGNEGCQYVPELLERFCRNVERHLAMRKAR
jgi:hypothetical protein